jgi:putative FmdB family regulatory protein
MPLYEYRCSACGAQEEKLQSFSAPTEHDCPQCGAPTGMARQISRTAFALSGSGWYASGYGSEPASAGASAAPAAESKTSEAKAGCATGCACHSPSVQAKVDALDKA